jgi:hypothetical protein
VRKDNNLDDIEHTLHTSFTRFTGRNRRYAILLEVTKLDSRNEVPSMSNVSRKTVDLSQYPDLVVIYLGMRVNALTGMKTLLGFGPKISKGGGCQA